MNNDNKELGVLLDKRPFDHTLTLIFRHGKGDAIVPKEMEGHFMPGTIVSATVETDESGQKIVTSPLCSALEHTF